MSSIITYLLLLFSLFIISLHACNARHLSTLDKKKLEKKPHLSFKISSGDDEKKGLDLSPKQVNNEDNKVKTTTRLLVSSDSDQNPNFRNRRRSTKNQRVLKTKGKGAIKTTTKSLASSSSSVSWRVPHKKPSEKNNPGFNLDYSPPKTHPPSHN